MPETFQRRNQLENQGTIFATRTPVCRSGAKPLRMSAKIFVEVADDFVRVAERGEHVHEAEHLHLEVLVLHRERHHALVEAGFAENGFGMLIDELENFLAAPLGFRLQGTHGRTIL